MRSHLRSPDEMNWSNTHLRAVGEIAELRFPQGQRVRLGERIAVFEAEHRLFRQHRIDDLEARLAVAEVVERRVAVLGLLVDQHRMALREGAALAVLAGEPHADGRRAAASRRRAPRRSPSRCRRRSRSTCGGCRGSGGSCGADGSPAAASVIFSPISFERRELDAGLAAARIVGIGRGLKSGPAAVEPIGLVGAVALRRPRARRRGGAPVGLHLLDFGLR